MLRRSLSCGRAPSLLVAMPVGLGKVEMKFFLHMSRFPAGVSRLRTKSEDSDIKLFLSNFFSDLKLDLKKSCQPPLESTIDSILLGRYLVEFHNLIFY